MPVDAHLSAAGDSFFTSLRALTEANATVRAPSIAEINAARCRDFHGSSKSQEHGRYQQNQLTLHLLPLSSALVCRVASRPFSR